MRRIKFTLCIVVMIVNAQVLALTGGQPANPSDYPGLVLVNMEFDIYHVDFGDFLETYKNECTGVALSKNQVLTTLDCITTDYVFQTFPDPFLATLIIPPSNIYVLPVNNGLVSANVTPSTPGNIRISNYVQDPLAGGGKGPVDNNENSLVILNLQEDISLPVAHIYNGKSKFFEQTATTLGWVETNGVLQLYQREVLLPQVPPICWDAPRFETGQAILCGELSQTNSLSRVDTGSPLLVNINGVNTVIGAFQGRAYQVRYDPMTRRYVYGRTTEMLAFFRRHAPETKFWNEKGDSDPYVKTLAPLLMQLELLD